MKERKRNHVKGIKISTVNIIMIMISCLLYTILIFATVHVSYRSNVMVEAIDDYISCEENATLMMNGSDYLTEQVRLYTVTQDVTYVETYFTEAYVIQRRDKALERLESYDISEDAHGYLKTALDDSDKLIQQEFYAIKLVSVAKGDDTTAYPDIQDFLLTEEDKALSPEEMIEKARNIVFGSTYQDAKESIQRNTSAFIRSMVGDTMQKEQDSVANLKHTVFNQQIIIIILFLEDVATFILIIFLVAKPLRIYSKNIKEEKMLEMVGSYEFKYLAMTYNHIYELNVSNRDMLSRQADMLRYQAEHDSVTGIMNRGAYNNLTDILKDDVKPLALMIIDVDLFKQVNDGYGHETGDRILKKVAGLLESSFRATDYPARIGGDEFAVIVTDITVDMKSVILDKVNAINMMLMNPIDDLPRVSLSVGVAFSEHGFEDDIYRKADAALYDVKKNGRCGCSFYDGQKIK